MHRPIVTLTTDFGLADAYVSQMKAVILRENPDARLIDITHLIAPQDVLAGSIALERAIAAFEPGTIHLAVIDPGVGTPRQILIAEINRQRIVCPDNGLITWVWRRHSGARASRLTWRPNTFSAAFHGRDIMAPIAGKLSRGAPVESLAESIDDLVLLDIAPSSHKGQIIHIDHFGNATTNLLSGAAVGAKVKVGRRLFDKVHHTYSDVSPGKPLALIGSSDLVEIAVRNGSAAQKLKLRVGDVVTLLPSRERKR